ncbi:MAG TPA: biotin transporter BioY [Erysipelothrix sp.]|nr:biotin transporter BioY [Erysipelothrix sp.]
MSAHLKIPIGFVPITFQLLVVSLIGLLLNKTQILFTMIGYIVLGLIGLPVFASGAGITYLASPSFGFIIGFVFFALILNYFDKRIIGLSIGYVVLYIIGLSYLTFIIRIILQNPISLQTIFVSYWAVFLFNDLLSIGLSLVLHKRLKVLVI